MERNPHYWQPEIVKSDSVRIIYVEDMNTSILAYETGAAHWHSDARVDYVSDMLLQKRQGERDDIHAFSTFGTYFWSFNCTPRFTDGRANPLHEAAVRRALSLTVNRQDIVTKVRRTEEKTASILVPSNAIGGFVSPGGLQFDPDRARQELASAGWVDRNGDGVPENEQGEAFPVIELLCTAVGPHKDTALAMGAMWERELGIRTKVLVKETKVYRQNLKNRDYMMARGGWYGDYLDPTTFLDLHKTGDGNNDRGFSDPVFDDLLERAADELDPAQRMAILSEAERYSMDEAAPVLPIWHYDQYYMFKPPVTPDGRANPGGLRNISTHPRLVQYIWLLDVVQPGDEPRAEPDFEVFVVQAGEGGPGGASTGKAWSAEAGTDQ
jgi:oligopeptide transport system substrate-binding protein